MGLEDWRNPIEQKVIKRKRSSRSESMNRRDFFKKGAATGAVVVAAGLAWNNLNKMMRYFEEDEKSVPESASEKKEVRELSGAEKVAEEILKTFNSPAVGRRFDPQVFTRDFFIAQQYQESRYKKEAESSAGAQGVYQDKPQATQDVVKYLSFLRKKTIQAPVKEQVNYTGPDNIDLDEAKEIGELFKEKGDYGRAVGKLYLLSIHDQESRYNNVPNRDVFRGQSSLEQQKLLLLAYHDGPARRLSPTKASKYGKEYVEHVFDHMQTIDDLRDRLERAGMSRDLDYAIIKIMRELERGENRKKQNDTKNYWLKELQDVHIAKWGKTGKYDESLNHDEVREVFVSNRR